jgi:hypothetical protein
VRCRFVLSQKEESVVKRLAVEFVVAVLWSLLAASTALAAAPSNDDISSPTVVGTLPYTDGPYDTTEATTGATDPGFCFAPSIGPDRATVWYSFTPAASGAYMADTFGSDYDTTLYVGTANGAGGIDVIACVDDSGGSLQSAVNWNAEAGTTYLIAVGTCCGFGEVGESGGGGGTLVFHVDAAPPPPTVDVTIDRTGGFTDDGFAVITGTIACSPDVIFAGVNVEVVQRAGRFTITGFGGTFLFECASPWTVFAFPQGGLFRGGNVEVTAFAFACDAFQCANDTDSRSVRLGGIVRPAVSPPVGPPPCPGPGPLPDPGPGPVSPPVKPPVSGPVGPPGCPPPVSRSVAAPAGGGSAIAGALRLEPAVLIAIALVGVLSVAGAAGAAAVVQTRRLAERTYSI